MHVHSYYNHLSTSSCSDQKPQRPPTPHFLSHPTTNQLTNRLIFIFQTHLDPPQHFHTDTGPILTSERSPGFCSCPLQSAKAQNKLRIPLKLVTSCPSSVPTLKVQPKSQGDPHPNLGWPKLANQNTGCPVKLNFRERQVCMGHILKKLVVVYVHFKFNWACCISPAARPSRPESCGPASAPPQGPCTHVPSDRTY